MGNERLQKLIAHVREHNLEEVLGCAISDALIFDDEAPHKLANYVLDTFEKAFEHPNSDPVVIASEMFLNLAGISMSHLIQNVMEGECDE